MAQCFASLYSRTLHIHVAATRPLRFQTHSKCIRVCICVFNVYTHCINIDFFTLKSIRTIHILHTKCTQMNLYRLQSFSVGFSLRCRASSWHILLPLLSASIWRNFFIFQVFLSRFDFVYPIRPLLLPFLVPHAVRHFQLSSPSIPAFWLFVPPRSL